MSDVFISYKRQDRTRVDRLVEAFQSEGIEVWIDHELEVGSAIGFNTEVELQINESKVVVVCWSTSAKDSIFVKAEALRALELKKLCPLFLDIVELPIPFNAVQTEDLSQWDGDRSNPAWIKCLNLVKEKCNSHNPAVLDRPLYVDLVRQLAAAIPETLADDADRHEKVLRHFLDARWDITGLLFALDSLIPRIPPESEGFWRHVANSGHYMPEEKDLFHAIQSLEEVKTLTNVIADAANNSLKVLRRASET